jgi:rhodanese-related sulfurtransferase
MTDTKLTLRHRALAQQGYDYSPPELRQIEWGLRFTPLVCMAGAAVGLATQQPLIHFFLAAMGILPFWFPSWHPMDRLYNHLLVPLWRGVPLPPNPLPRRIACFMGGMMNIGIGISFVLGSPAAAYGFGAVLVTLQLVVISTHFCVASWMFEGLLRSFGRWVAPISVQRARDLLGTGGLLVDVRTREEYSREHIEGAINLPVDDIDGLQELGFAPDQDVVLYCRSGLRVQRAIQLLQQRGYSRLHSLGAMARWKRE